MCANLKTCGTVGRKLLKTVQTMTTFRNPLADPWEPIADPLWSADPSLKTAEIADQTPAYSYIVQTQHTMVIWNSYKHFLFTTDQTIST